MSVFEQGDLIEMDFGPTLGHEPQKRRPALVVSVGFFNNVLSNLAVVCPITSVPSTHPLDVCIPDGSAARGWICLEAIRAVDLRQRHAVSLGDPLDAKTMAHVLDGIGGIFGI